jgi:hypothetical protein
MEKGKFEDSVNEAFRNAEVTPRNESWRNIALELERANGASLKRKVLVYQLLAAACVIFTIGISLGMYLVTQQNNDLSRELALHQKLNSVQPGDLAEPDGETKAQPETKSEIQNTEQDPSQHVTNDHTGNLARNTTGKIPNDRILKNEKVENFDGSKFAAIAVNENSSSTVHSKDENILLSHYNEKTLPLLYRPWKPQIISKKSNNHLDPVAFMLAQLDDREKEIQEKSNKKEKQRSEKLWTSLGLAAGSFNSASSSGVTSRTTANQAIAMNNTVADQEASANGMAYSVGISLGGKISDRWVLQGGVNYLSQSSEYTVQNAVTSADFATFRPASINELGKLNVAAGDARVAEEKLVSTAPYDVNNDLRYLSIPLQAGYLVVNRAFGIQVNAGFATDLFLENTVSAENDNLASSTQESGADSPYRSVNFSGLVGTELSYRFAKHYRVALNPGIRYPLNTIYKSEIGVDATPVTFDLGLRFRYIFN